MGGGYGINIPVLQVNRLRLRGIDLNLGLGTLRFCLPPCVIWPSKGRGASGFKSGVSPASPAAEGHQLVIG